MAVLSSDQEGLVDDIEVIRNSVLGRHLDGMVRSDQAEAGNSSRLQTHLTAPLTLLTHTHTHTHTHRRHTFAHGRTNIRARAHAHSP